MTRREKVLGQHRDAIRAVAERNKARAIALVGSVARGDDNDDSDYDFLVDFLPKASLFDIARLEVALEQMLGAKVDVVPSSCVRDTHRGMADDAIVL